MDEEQKIRASEIAEEHELGSRVRGWLAAADLFPGKMVPGIMSADTFRGYDTKGR
jgi:hypothetical protein